MKKLICLCLALMMAALFLPGLAEQEPTVDIDLTAFSDTIAYAQVLNMLITPEEYIGKIVRMAGWLDIYYDTAQDIVYLSCMMQDQTACCATGLEFLWDGEHAYPEDYPEYGAPLTVTGRFETYYEDEWLYAHLTDTQVVWAEEEKTL